MDPFIQSRCYVPDILLNEEKTCINCNSNFTVRSDGRGYNRYCVIRKLNNCDTTAQAFLESLGSITFSTGVYKDKSEFLCRNCFVALGHLHRCHSVSSSFWSKTSPNSYIGKQLFGNEEYTFEPLPTVTPCINEKEVSRSPKASGYQKGNIKSKCKRRVSHKWKTIANTILQRNYGAAVRALYNASPGSRKQFIKITKKEIRKEVKLILQSDLILLKKADLTNIETVSWKGVFEQLEEIAPLLTAFLKAASTLEKNEEVMHRGKKQAINVLPVVGTALSCLLYARTPLAAFLPTVISLQLWRGGLKREAMALLSKLGICQSELITLPVINSLKGEFYAKEVHCRADLKERLNIGPGDATTSRDRPVDFSQMEIEINNQSECENIGTCVFSTSGHDNSSTADIKVPEPRVFSEEESSTGTLLALDSISYYIKDYLPAVHPGFTFCWDNVGKKLSTNRPIPDKQNPYINFAFGFLAENRVPSSDLDYKSTIPASQIPINRFLPSQDDFQEVRSRMEVLVSRILVRHLKWFNEHTEDCVIKHVPHEHSVESAKPSVFVNLGVFKDNPSTIEGAIGIYEQFQKYMPKIHGQSVPTLVFGDDMSCEQGSEALKARCYGATEIEKLEGLEPAAQEFHKETIMLQDYFDEFFQHKSATERGTLNNNKNTLKFHELKLDTSEHFSQSWELMSQTTESYICLMAMDILGLSDLSERPPTAPLHIEEDILENRQKYLTDVSEDIVTKVWHNMDTKAFHNQPEDDTGFCCQKEIDDKFISCENGRYCLNGEWFHLTCMDIDQDNMPDVWFCSAECKKGSNQEYQYCFCSKDLGSEEEMIGCSAGSNCKNREWYHLHCIGMMQADIPDDKWFCCDECRQLTNPEASPCKIRKIDEDSRGTYVPDYMYRHNIAITWSGLNLMIRRDAVNEADGQAMMSHWRIDLVHFFNKRHPKYVTLAHRLLAGINGWLPQKLSQEIRWNRTVNFSGGMGQNLPLDFMNIIYRRLLKSLIRGSKNHLPPKKLAQCSQMIEPLDKTLDVAFHSKDIIIEEEIARYMQQSSSHDRNVELLINKLKKRDMFSVRPGRAYRTFPVYECSMLPKSPGQFLAKIKKLSSVLD